MLPNRRKLWAVHGQNDKRNQELVYPPDGLVYPYEEALERAHPDIANLVDEDLFRKQHANLTNAIEELASSLRAAKPDAVIIISDDQDEVFFEDNMPSFSIYWGETMPLIARTPPESAPPAVRAMAWGYGDVSMDVPVDTGLAATYHEHLTRQRFRRVALQVPKEESGGFGPAATTPNGESTFAAFRARQQACPTARLLIKRLMHNEPSPRPRPWNLLPRQATPKRATTFGLQIKGSGSQLPHGRPLARIGPAAQPLRRHEELGPRRPKAMVDNDTNPLPPPQAPPQLRDVRDRNWIRTAVPPPTSRARSSPTSPSTARPPARGGWAWCAGTASGPIDSV